MLSHQRPNPTGPLGDQAGFTLVEVLVALMVLGITFGAVLGGMATSINTSDLHRQQAQVQAVLASAVEKVKSPETTRVPCADVTTYQSTAASVAPPVPPSTTPWLIEVLSVSYSNGAYLDDDSVTNNVSYGFSTTDCYDTAALGNLLKVQRIEIRVTHPGGRHTRTMTFLKGVG